MLSHAITRCRETERGDVFWAVHIPCSNDKGYRQELYLHEEDAFERAQSWNEHNIKIGGHASHFEWIVPVVALTVIPSCIVSFFLYMGLTALLSV